MTKPFQDPDYDLVPPLPDPGEAWGHKKGRQCGERAMDANQEMIAGYLDGFRLENPEPSGNRSFSYRHGFANGRADKTGKWRGYTLEELECMAEEAMRLDGEI